MQIKHILAKDSPTCSFEFFPPKSEKGAERLFENVRQLETLNPSFVSMTYGAGGSTRELTHRLVSRLLSETRLHCMPHLTCVGHTQPEMEEILEAYRAAGVHDILALGGDPPSKNSHYDRSQDRFQHASDLVAYIRDFNRNASGEFGVGVAGFPEGHPATPNRLEEMDHLKAKVDRGADFIITQLFFDNNDFYDFRERCVLAGINVPVIAGIMPVTSREGMTRMAQLALGARFPARLQNAVARCGGQKDAISRVGVHWATQQCRDLLDNQVSGLHFYTLNKSQATFEIYRSLGISSTDALRETSAQ